jgi:hypothetical protein
VNNFVNPAIVLKNNYSVLESTVFEPVKLMSHSYPSGECFSAIPIKYRHVTADVPISLILFNVMMEVILSSK